MSEYLVVIEKAADTFGASVPDLPGCVAFGDTVAEVQHNIQESIALHLSGMREDGISIPVATTQAYIAKIA